MASSSAPRPRRTINLPARYSDPDPGSEIIPPNEKEPGLQMPRAGLVAREDTPASSLASSTNAAHGTRPLPKNQAVRRLGRPPRHGWEARSPGTDSGFRDVHGFNIPPLGPDHIKIYDWTPTRPTPPQESFTNLPKYRLDWKSKEDKAPVDPSFQGDDWENLEALEDLSSQNSETSQLAHAIAGNFMKRAKRLFKTGTTWDDFIKDEITLHTTVQGTHGWYRLAVLEVFAERLCNEIWLKEYSGSLPIDWSLRDVHADQSNADATAGTTANPDSLSAMYPNRPELLGFTSNRYGIPEPYYEGEAHAPNWIQSQLNVVLGPDVLKLPTPKPSARRRVQKTLRRYRKEPVFNGIGVHGPVGSQVEAIARGAPDMGTSDEGE